MTIDFNDYFWGEKNNGFDVLYHNMKFGLVASKELSEFFREKSNAEEQNSKMMSKLAHKASTGTLNSTFAPVWTILRTSAEKLSTLHLQMVQKLTELVKDVSKYADELHKKHKMVKEEESQTLESVQAMQSSTSAVQKARDLYTSKVVELEKLRKENGTQKDIEKVESKLKKLQEEYKTLLDKHNPIKNDFERRMTQTCKRFQEIEEVHLRQMKEFLSTYLELLQNNHDMVGQVHSDFKRQFLDMSVDKLLELFVLNKYTGLEKPEVAELDFITLSIQQQQSASTLRLSQPSVAVNMSAATTNSNSAASLPAIARNVSSDQRGCSTEGVSLGSGSGSLMNADGAIIGFLSNTNSSFTAQPLTTPDAISVNTSAIAASASPPPSVSSLHAINMSVASTIMPASPASTITTSSPPSSSAVTTTASTTFVKSNFRNWFSSSIPNKQQSGNNNTTSTTTAVSGSSGNFGTDSNGSTTTGTTTTITKNSPNSELQDNNNQDQRHALRQPNISSPSQSTVSAKVQSSLSVGSRKFSTSLNENSIHHRQHHHNASLTAHDVGGGSSSSNSRRTTSLLNIFTSNSQVSGILRSRRDKTKTKKSKKKKDDETAEQYIQEERLASIERANSHEPGTNGGGEGRNDQQTGRSKMLSLASGNAGGLTGATNAAVKSVGGAEANTHSSGVTANVALRGGNGAVTTVGSSGGSSATNVVGVSNTVGIGASGVVAYAANIDEDGYSVQPPKEIAWEENNDNAGSFYSDSDSDSDNDKPERRIHVKIKPLNNGQAPMSASVDELRATVENISLSPTGVFSHSQQLQQTRIPSRQQSPEISNASTPTASVHPYAPLQSPTFSLSNNSRYADLGDIFSELGDMSASAPASATLSKSSNRQIPTPTLTSSIAIPRPPSRRSEMMVAAAAAASSGTTGVRGRNSPSPMNRADSIGSLEFRTAIGCLGSSRGPSPLTIGISETIPLAVAFHEIIHAFFRGSDESRCQVKISGDMMISFPAGIAGLLANNPSPAKLGFRIKNVQYLENWVPNAKLVQINDKNQPSGFGILLEFNMMALTALLRRQAEHNPTASYFNVDILKYQVRTKPGASSCPFQLVSYWKCESNFTALKIDYKYNNHAMASASPLLNVTLSVPVNGSVRNVQSKPHSAWLGESNRLVWNFTDISQNSTDGGVGTLRARLELNEGPSQPALLTTQFNSEGTTLSGIEFELQGSGYRLSLVKRRFVSGKYICEGDGVPSCVTPTPTSVGSTSPYSAKSN